MSSSPPLSENRSVIGAGLATAVLIFGLGLLAVAVRSPSSRVLFPAEWDPRVIDLVMFVEDTRELRFEHPVYIDFLTDDEYSALTRSDDSELTDADAASIADSEAFFRALALAEGELNFFESSNTISDTGTLAFYDPVSKRVTVRGTTITPALEVTLVHELTHVIQDQAFDLQAVRDSGPQAGSAVLGLIEGDATRIENAYIAEGLTDEERDSYIASFSSDDTAAIVEELGSVPETLLLFFQAPYLFGENFVNALGAKGTDAIDGAFGDQRPESEEQLIDARTYFGADAPIAVDTPDVAGDLLDSGTIDSFAWYLMLSTRIDPFVALTAVDGWGGDAYATYRDRDRVCARIDLVTDTPADGEEFFGALEQWRATLPEGMATVERADDRIEVTTCDPGVDVALGLTGTANNAVSILAARAFLFADAMQAYAVDDAFCIADAITRALTIDQHNDPEASIFADGTFTAVLEASVAGCVG